MDQNQKNVTFGYDPSVTRQSSMGTLIMWNISKAVKTNPSLDLQSAIQATQERLLSKTDDIVNTSPEDQYLTCAILAWQQLGHNGSESLYQFIQTKQKEAEFAIEKNKQQEKIVTDKKNNRLSPGSFISYNDPSVSNAGDSTYYDAMGPVVKLPVETKIVMRVENCKSCTRDEQKKQPEKALLDKIDSACCKESPCLERLSNLDKETKALRTRAQSLAKREAQRVELLERAEAAWKDLEKGYQRRLAAAEEKEADMIKQIHALIQERNGHKNACPTLAKQLKEKGDAAEKERDRLTALEKEVCCIACDRLRLSEEAAHLEAELSELQCKSTQLDREIQVKEEQIRGKLQNMENEVDCARALTYEAERVIHAELTALRDQISSVSGLLLEEDEHNTLIKQELEQIRSMKMEMVQDLEGCQALCNERTKDKTEELNKKREQLRELREKFMECQCKLPVDAAVEVKRTPSLVALCKCTPEENFSETCSCTSLRTTLLTNLMADLFGGLQSELDGCCAQMPCQLLKCLEDKHNWDKASVIKTNLENYFSKLLVGELDIAIATSIEKYHARWVGASCADAVREITNRCGCGAEPDCGAESVIEKRALQLAAKLAEQLFQERADQLTAKAKEVLNTEQPPCECKGRSGDKTLAAVYPCFVKQPALGSASSKTNAGAVPAYWRRTHQNVAQLRSQLEDLKKVSIKKEDLKILEQNIVKVVQRSIPETTDENIVTKLQETQNNNCITKESTLVGRSVNTDQANKRVPATKLSSIKKKQEANHPKQVKKNILLGLQEEKSDKPIRKLGNSYAVNLCLCGMQREAMNRKMGPGKKHMEEVQNHESKKPSKGLVINDVLPQTSAVKQTKPTVKQMHSEDINNRKKNSDNRPGCRSDVACFHKPPSNTSIDNLLSTLAKWKCDLFKFNTKTEEQIYENNNQDTNEKILINNSTPISKNVSVKTSVNKANFYKENVADVSEGTDLQNDLPVNTNSEYMGAINLEKSNENFCKCVIDKENILKTPYSCLNNAPCDCNVGSKNKAYGDSQFQYKEIAEQTNLNSESQRPDALSERKISADDINSNIRKEQMDLSSLKKNVNDNDDNDISKTSPLIPADSEYCITFLGVTLTNSSSRNHFAGTDNACYNLRTSVKTKNRKGMRKTETFVPDDKEDIKTTGLSIGDDVNFSTTSPETQMGSCHCSNKIDEFKSLIQNELRKQRADVHENEDKALDTSSLINSKPGSCVCCSDNKTDESRDLEVNAFHLLKEHLRDKLDEFKITTCKSACISSSDEEKLFSAILKQVRQIISDTTLNVACKCVNEEPSEGSWNRAYILLQEYLKTKIKRVQCLCHSPDNSTKVVLPDVLEKVCNLIESDFQRLKSLCKCKTVTNRTNKTIDSGGSKVLEVELPERDTNVNYRPKTPSIDKGISKQSMLPMQSTESQVSSNIGTNANLVQNDTSCNCGFRNCPGPNQKKTSKSNVQFEENVIINQFIDASKPNVSASKEVTNIANLQTTNLSSENPEQNIFRSTAETPYIGYTVDCSCDRNLGKCSCSKSLVSKNTDNIKNIWSAVTSNTLNVKKHSYIMNSVSDKRRNINELMDTNKTDFEKTSVKALRDAKISVFDSEDITLKISKEKLHKPIIPSNTTVTSDENLSTGTEEPINWCDCSSTKSRSRKVTDVSDNTWSGSLYYPINDLKNRKKNVAKGKSAPIKPKFISPNCECNMVPMCHVKMLVESIEKKLIHSKCTCDSLHPNVCPEHSKKNIDK